MLLHMFVNNRLPTFDELYRAQRDRTIGMMQVYEQPPFGDDGTDYLDAVFTVGMWLMDIYLDGCDDEPRVIANFFDGVILGYANQPQAQNTTYPACGFDGDIRFDFIRHHSYH